MILDHEKATRIRTASIHKQRRVDILKTDFTGAVRGKFLKICFVFSQLGRNTQLQFTEVFTLKNVFLTLFCFRKINVIETFSTKFFFLFFFLRTANRKPQEIT